MARSSRAVSGQSLPDARLKQHALVQRPRGRWLVACVARARARRCGYRIRSAGGCGRGSTACGAAGDWQVERLHRQRLPAAWRRNDVQGELSLLPRNVRPVDNARVIARVVSRGTPATAPLSHRRSAGARTKHRWKSAEQAAARTADSSQHALSRSREYRGVKSRKNRFVKAHVPCTLLFFWCSRSLGVYSKTLSLARPSRFSL